MTYKELTRIVSRSRADTTTAAAFRRAVGIGTRPRRKRPAKRRSGRYRGVRECMENRETPMDWHCD